VTVRTAAAGTPSASALGAPAWLLAFVAALTLARLAAAAAIPLTEDEAYYRLWAASLQLGYYDHPPMIAWWIRTGLTLAGDSPLGVRLIPTLAAGLTGLLVFDLAARLGAGRASAARAAVWFNATLLIGLGGQIATPDVAATPFWVATLCCLARTGKGRDAGWWLAAGATAGLACLSKYSALFMAPGVVIWLVMTPAGRARLLTPWPWMAALVAGAIFSLNVAWNAGHHWVTFVKQFGRIAPHGLKPQFLAELIVGQALLLNPLITVFAARGLAAAGRAPGRPDQVDGRLILATSLPFAAYLILHSLHDRVQAHWPVPLYPGLAILAAAAAERARGWLAGLRRWAAPAGLTIAGLGLAHLALPATDVHGLADPTGAVRGWPDFARAVNRVRDRQGAAWIGTLSYGVTAQLDAAGADAPVVELAERDRYLPNDASWRADVAKPGVVVDLRRRSTQDALAPCFARVTPLGELVRGSDPDRHSRYAVFRVEGARPDLLTNGCDAALKGTGAR
jgi:4-amino-4-deoxy-L-arabinose transferase-like glycosyltransferase